MIKTIILDFDGVIVESVDIKTDAFKELFKSYPDKQDEILNYHLANNALSRYIKFEYIYREILKKKYNEEVKNKLGREFSNLVFQKVIECPYVTGAKDFLKSFSEKYPLYVASATPQEELNRIILARNLNKYFKKVWGTPPGNKIEFIHNILKKENAKPTEAVYIGDMLKDFEIAKKTGVFFIGRKNKESFDGLNVPQYTDFSGIIQWLTENSIEKKGSLN